MFMYLLLRSWKIISTIVNIMKLLIWKQEDLVGTISLTWVYTFKTWKIKGKFYSNFKIFSLIILRNMSLLNQLTSSRNNSLKPWSILGESVWTMQNSSRQLFWQRFEMQHLECYQDFPSFSLVTYICLPDMTHIRKWTRYHQYKHSDKVSSCWSCCGHQSINKIFLHFGLVTLFLTRHHPYSNLA